MTKLFDLLKAKNEMVAYKEEPAKKPAAKKTAKTAAPKEDGEKSAPKKTAAKAKKGDE